MAYSLRVFLPLTVIIRVVFQSRAALQLRLGLMQVLQRQQQCVSNQKSIAACFVKALFLQKSVFGLAHCKLNN